MAVEHFTNLLSELGELMNAELKPDDNGSCLINFPSVDVKVQVEVDRSGENLIIGSEIKELPAGKFRENLFKASLISNTLPPPRYGTFAFSRQTNSLILFKQLPLENLQGIDIIDALAPLAEKAHKWKESIERGEVPDVNQDPQAPQGSSGLFGLTS